MWACQTHMLKHVRSHASGRPVQQSFKLLTSAHDIILRLFN